MKDSIRSILQDARGLEPELRSIRRDLHRHPELAFKEVRTTAVIRDYLRALPGIRLWDLRSPTGVIAELPGRTAKTVVLRADMDALPIQELNTHDYASEYAGKMHACGHDGHVAALLGAARLLANLPERPHAVRLVFQPAEEVVPSGASDMLKEGALDHASRIFGFHLNATSDFGLVGFYDGPVMAGGIAFTIEIQGKGGHSAYPDACVNPIYCASDIIASLTRIKDAIHPSYACNIVPVSVHSGEYNNKIPEVATIEGRFKYLDAHAATIFRREIRALVKGCALKNHVRCHLTLMPCDPVSVNRPALGESVVRPAAKRLGLPLVRIVPSMGSEDFALYAQKKPAYYMTFGIRKGKDFPIAHTSHFDFDEAILPLASAQLVACALMS